MSFPKCPKGSFLPPDIFFKVFQSSFPISLMTGIKFYFLTTVLLTKFDSAINKVVQPTEILTKNLPP